MSTRERLPRFGLDIGESCTVFQTDLGFSVAQYGCWLPGLYQTFEAAEMAFQLSDEQIYSLRYRAWQQERLINLHDIESLL